jgi:hypothetical protein
MLVILMGLLMSIPGAQAQSSDAYMLRSEIQHQRRLQELDKEKQRVEEIGKDADKTFLCFKRADRELVKLKKDKSKKLTEKEEESLVEEIVNECCLEVGCKGI